jgi:hypothetical protein
VSSLGLRHGAFICAKQRAGLDGASAIGGGHPVTTCAVGCASVCLRASPLGGIASLAEVMKAPLNESGSAAPVSDR